MNGTKIVIQKELTRVFRDKKLIFSLFILPAVVMIGIYALIGKMMTNMADDINRHIPVMYIQNEPEGFDAFLKKTGFQGTIHTINADNNLDQLKNDILHGNADLIVSFQTDFLPMIDNYKDGDKIPEVKTYYNPSEDYSSQARETFVNTVLNPYQQQLLSKRVGNLDSLVVFHVDVNSKTSIIQDEDKANGKLLGMLLPYLIVMLLFTGPMSLGIDAITGEKERGTMASMLITPLKRSEIVMGKLLSLSILSCLSAIVYAGAMIIAVPMMYSGMGEKSGMSISAKFSFLQIVELLVIMLILVYLYVTVVSLIAVYAKTAKEAGTYISPIYMIVIVAGILTMYSGNSEEKLALFGIPVYGSAACIQKIMTNELTAAQFGINFAGTMLIAVILTVLITKAFNSEKVMFNA